VAAAAVPCWFAAATVGALEAASEIYLCARRRVSSCRLDAERLNSQT
jgi:hypothetical protein